MYFHQHRVNWTLNLQTIYIGILQELYLFNFIHIIFHFYFTNKNEKLNLIKKINDYCY